MKQTTPSTATSGRRRVDQALVFGFLVVASLAALTACLGLRTTSADEMQRQRAHFLEAGRDSALMLTTVRHDDVESDVKHIVASSTGAFLADFRNRSQEFVDTVTRTQSNTQGTIAEAGLESVRGDQADVLVVVSVKTSLNGTDSPARLWRMRVAIQKVGGAMKLSNVEFIA